MPVFQRRSKCLERHKHYRDYRDDVRDDFMHSCAYCLLPEILAGGKDNFELDHFYPKSRSGFHGDVNDFYNLYYSCHPCNHNKGAAWPGERDVLMGFHFVDLCSEEFHTHFRPDRNGEWKALTAAAQYTIERLRLNKSHLVEIRRYLNDILEIRGLGEVDWRSPIRDVVELIFDAQGKAANG